MEYHRTKDILHAMRLVDQKNINNTLSYNQLVSFRDEEYISRVTQNVQELRQLVEAGSEYVIDMDGVKVFRKCK